MAQEKLPYVGSSEMKRNGEATNVLKDGHPRRMADGKNAWRKMNEEQREEFVDWMLNNGLESFTREVKK